jgi:hypothetical protein
MRFSARGWARGAGLLTLGLCVWITRSRPAEGGPLDDGVPSGTIAYFPGGTCPAGWSVATSVQGRLVVAVADGGAAGVQVGAPLGDQEDRMHAHTWSGTVTLASMSLAAADGSNDNGAAAQGYAVSGTTDAGASALPFIQIQACEKP